jgi:hypothetical protein
MREKNIPLDTLEVKGIDMIKILLMLIEDF